MKLKCNDGIIRSFSVARADGDRMPDGSRFDGFAEAKCEECGQLFGCHDTSILKPVFKKHACEKEGEKCLKDI